MKKVISLLLSIVMMFSITAGVDLSAYAAAVISKYQVHELGSTTTCDITAINQRAYVQFTLTESGRVNITVEALLEDSSDNNTWGDCYIYDKDGVKIQDFSLDVDDGRGKIYDDDLFIDLVSGTYYFSLEPYHSGYTGWYKFSTYFQSANESFAETVDENDNKAIRANEISINNTYKGQIGWNDDVDYYQFTVPAGHYLLSARSLFCFRDKETQSGYFEICTLDETEIAFVYTEKNGTGYYDGEVSQYLDAGTYCIKANSWSSDATGNYSFSITPQPHKAVTEQKKATFTEHGYFQSYCSECDTLISFKYYFPVSNVKLEATNLTYNGKVRTPNVTVRDSQGKTLVKNKDYTVYYASGRKNVGKYAVKVTLKGNYSGTKTLYFTIKPKATSISSVSAGSKKFTVKWKKQSTQVTGYQIQYSTSSKFSKAKTVTIGKNSTTSKTISKLKGKKKYYVRVRTYKTVGKTKYYSSWSSAKSVTTKK